MSADELAIYAAKLLLKRLGEPADIANANLFLASDEASYIPAAMAHLGRPNTLPVIVELRADRVFADLFL